MAKRNDRADIPPGLEGKAKYISNVQRCSSYGNMTYTERPIVLFVDGNDKIGKSSMITRLVDHLKKEYPKYFTHSKSIQVFHQTKNPLIRKNQFPSLITSGDLLNYTPNVSNIETQAYQLGLSFTYSNMIALEENYDDLKLAKLLIMDRGPLSSAVYGLGLAMSRAKNKAYDWHYQMNRLYYTFSGVLEHTRFFNNLTPTVHQLVLAPESSEMLINIHNFHQNDPKLKDPNPNVFEDSLDMTLLMYHMFLSASHAIEGGSEFSTIMMNIPERKRPIVHDDYTSNYVKQVGRILDKRFDLSMSKNHERERLDAHMKGSIDEHMKEVIDGVYIIR